VKLKPVAPKLQVSFLEFILLFSEILLASDSPFFFNKIFNECLLYMHWKRR